MWLRRHRLCEQEMEAERAWLQMAAGRPVRVLPGASRDGCLDKSPGFSFVFCFARVLGGPRRAATYSKLLVLYSVGKHQVWNKKCALRGGLS